MLSVSRCWRERAVAALEDGRPNEAEGALDEALRLWRGTPYPDLDGCSQAQAETARLEELHRGAVENRLDALVASGAHASSIADLESAVAEEPLRERRWELLMVALYRSGRQADALRAFQRARSLLIDELGIEPGPALRDLDRAIAAQDESLGVPANLAARTPPRQLIAEVRRATAQRLAGQDRYRVTIHQAAQRALDVGDDDALSRGCPGWGAAGRCTGVRHRRRGARRAPRERHRRAPPTTERARGSSAPSGKSSPHPLVAPDCAPSVTRPSRPRAGTVTPR